MLYWPNPWFLVDRTIGRAFGTLCRLSLVCLSSVTFCIVAERYVLAKNCLKEWIRNQGQKVDFGGSPPYFYFWFHLYSHWEGRFCLIFARRAHWSALDGGDLDLWPFYRRVNACRRPVMEYMSTNFSVDSSRRFPFRGRTHRHTLTDALP